MKLPQPFQREALDFIEFLAQKAARGETVREDAEWEGFSLAQAMRGFEDEDSPTYSEDDIKESWR